MKVNVNNYIEKVNNIVESVNKPEFINILLKPNNSKTYSGSFQLNIVIKNTNTRKKVVYSIYINEFKFENALRTTVMIVDSSSYNYNMLFYNASDTAIEKSYKYINNIISNGLEKVQRVSSYKQPQHYRKTDDAHETDKSSSTDEVNVSNSDNSDSVEIENEVSTES